MIVRRREKMVKVNGVNSLFLSIMILIALLALRPSSIRSSPMHRPSSCGACIPESVMPVTFS